MLIEILQGWRVGIIIEIAGDDNLCIPGNGIDRIHCLCQLASHLQAIRTGNLLTTPTAWRMNHEDMQGIACDNQSRSLENISRRSGSGQGLDANGMRMEQGKGSGLIQ